MEDELSSRVATGYGVDSSLLDLLTLVQALHVCCSLTGRGKVSFTKYTSTYFKWLKLPESLIDSLYLAWCQAVASVVWICNRI